VVLACVIGGALGLVATGLVISLDFSGTGHKQAPLADGNSAAPPAPTPKEPEPARRAPLFKAKAASPIILPQAPALVVKQTEPVDPASPPELPALLGKKAQPTALEPAPEKPVKAEAAALVPSRVVDATTARLLKAMASPARATRLSALKDLGNTGTAAREAIPLLIERLCRDHHEVANQATLALAQIGAASVPELIKILDDASPAARHRALWALAVIGPDARPALGPVGESLKDRDPKIRALAAQALGEMGPHARPAAPLLARALQDPDDQVRRQAAEALHAIGPGMAVHLLPVLKDQKLAVRLSALQALATFHESTDAVQALVNALHDPERKVRTVAASALVQLGAQARAAVPGLLDNLEVPDLELQTQAFTALMAIGSPGDTKLLDALGKASANGGWARPRGKEAVPSLLRALADPNPTERLGAVLALGQLGPDAKAAVAFLAMRLTDPNRSVRAATALALTVIDPQRKADVGAAEVLIDEIRKDLKVALRPDPEELIQLQLLVSTLSCAGPWAALHSDRRLSGSLQRTQDWVKQAVDELPYSPWVIPAFVRGINSAAEFDLGFADPFSRLSLKLQALVQDSKDIQALSYAMSRLGQGVPSTSPFFAAIQRNRYHVITSSHYLDWLIATKQQALLRKQQASLVPETASSWRVSANRFVVSKADRAVQKWMGDLPELGWFLRLGRPCCNITSFAQLRADYFNAKRSLPFAHMPSDPFTWFQSPSRTAPSPSGIAISIAQDQADLFALQLLKTQAILRKADERTRAMWGESDAQLIARLQESDPWVRWVAANFIGQKRIRAEKELIERLNDVVPQVRHAAHQALVRLGRGTDFGPHPLDSQENTQRAMKCWHAWLALQDPPSPVVPPSLETSPPRPNLRESLFPR
jgi:HEAT repeat protein